MAGLLTRVFAWIARHERSLGALLFIGGFATDLVAFTLLSIDLVNLAFLGYLALAAVATIGTHTLASRPIASLVGARRVFQVLFPLAAQYAIGGILSGCLIFYTKSSVVDVSWPFLLLLALVFIGNEYFRLYREYLSFQAVLLFFALYAYSIFALPLVLGSLGRTVFLMSTALAAVVFALFLWLLWVVGKRRFQASLGHILGGVAATIVLIVGAYFTHLIPPIPLALKEAGIYHRIERIGGDYRLQTEGEREWWNLGDATVHITPGAPLYAYSSVAAPVAFSTGVVHRWEKEVAGKWKEESRVAFLISGGREQGYRGYSLKENATPGRWRVSIETPDGQVIGRVGFVVAGVGTPPVLREIVR